MTEPKTSAPFSITRHTLLPEEVVQVVLGEILHVGFGGMTAFVWVKHHPAEQRVMNIVTLPTGGPFTLQTDEGYQDPVHIGSFQKAAAVQLSKQVEQKVAMAWHCFVWHPKVALPVAPAPESVN